MTEKVMGLFILDGKGNFGQGFIVSLKNYSGDLPSLSAMEDGVSGELPPAPDLPGLYETWKIAYRNYLDIRVYNPADNHPAAFIRERPVDTNVSGDYQGWENQKQQAYHACTEAEKALLKRFHEWLNSADFGEVKDTLKAYLLQSKDKANRILIESNDKDFQKMPWQKWDLLTPFSLSEVGLSSPNFKKRYVPIKPKEQARVLVILGHGANIQQEIQQLATANIEIKVVTTLAELDEPLWNEAWDIIVFNGHSNTYEKGTEGEFQLSSGQGLKIEHIRNHLNKAIDQGLKLVIFNSCDGLGLAHQLGEGQQLYLPQIMVMRDLLPMPLAPIFLQYFFEEFIKGISLYSALRATRDRLEFPTIKDEFPCASWLPVICQNPALMPPTWNDLRGVESGINWREVSQNALAERQRLTTNPLTTGDGVEFTFDDIYVPLGLVEKVKKEKRPGEVSPEEGSQFYQPEEVTRTYKNDEFFAQVLKQGQSPKSQGRRLAVTGEPGAGKTTLLQKTAQWVAAETERDVAIWVSLADLQERSIEDYLLQKWLKDALGAVRVTPEMEDALALLFKSGRVWLLLDGVDEMGGSNPLATVANQISGWVASARVVVTCRQNVWDAGKNALEGFDVYRNLDFDYPEGVGQFIHGWFARHPELGERLLAELAQAGKERIRDTVRNPLRLALLCRAWQNRQGSLPETKAGLYGQFAEALYDWKQEAFPTTSQQRRDLNAALGRLGLRGMEQSESRFRLREGLVTEVLGEKDEPLCQLALQLGWINRVGVAVENTDERVYAFYHPTFQEYFAALAVDDWGYFLHHVPDNPSLGTYRIFEKQWKEVILLWFGRENVEKEAFIERLVNFDDGCGDWNYPKVDRGFYEYRAYFLAGAIVPEFKDSRLADEIVNQIFKNCVSYLYSIKTGANAVLVETDRSRAINHLIRILDETSSEDTRRRVADILLGQIALKNEGAIFRLIELLDETSDESTRRMIADSLRKIALGNKGSIFRLIQLLYKTSFEYQQFAYGLGKIAVENQDHINSLLQQLDQNSDEFTRREIADILGKTASGNEQAINRLIQLLNETPDDTTRRFIVDSLGKIAVGNEGAILRLIQLLDETSNAHILRSVVDSLGKIAFGYKWVIFRLVKVLYETSSKYIHQGVTDSLGKIALGNHGAIFCLIQLLNENPSESTCRGVADSLGKIAVGNEGAIFWLIQLLNENSSESTCRGIVDSLGKIAVGNERATDQLIQLLDKTLSESTRRVAAAILGIIAEGNEGAINQLIQLLNKTSSESTRRSVAEILGKIAVKNESAIHRLIQLLDETSDESTRRSVADSLGRIAKGNEGAIKALKLLQQTSDESTKRLVTNILWEWEHPPVAMIAPEPPILDESTRRRVIALSSKTAKGNKGAIDRLIQLLDENNKLTRATADDILNRIKIGTEEVIDRLIQLIDKTSDESTQRMVADILGRIEAGHEGAIKRLILLLDKTSDESTRRVIANSLGKIAVGNEEAIFLLLQLLDETSDENTRRIVAYILGKIIVTDEQYCRLVAVLKHNLNKNIYKNKFDVYEQCYQLIWQCAQNLTYPEFYTAWHQTPNKLCQKLWKQLNRPIF